MQGTEHSRIPCIIIGHELLLWANTLAMGE